MSKKSGGQFSNPSSQPKSPFEGIFGEEDNSDTLLMGHFQTNLVVSDISVILGNQHSSRHSSLNGYENNTLHSNHHQVVDPAATVPMDAGLISPTDELNHRILEQIQREYFVAWANENKHTCAYINPFTREIFLSGELIDQVSAIKDGLAWYQSAEEAQDAAVARALDCFELREKSPRPYGLRVKESPYAMDCGPLLPSAVPPAARRLGLAHNKPANVNTESPGFSSVDLSSISSHKQDAKRPTTTTPQVRDRNTHPISTLAEFYRNSDFFGNHKGLTLTKANFVTWYDGQDHVRSFTCAFVCPVSGEIFLSGNWTHTEDGCQETNNGLKWYKSKKKAEGAAAAVAHDCYSLRYQLSIYGVAEEARFCIEDPYQNGARSETEIAQLVPTEYWSAIQKLQASSRSGYTVL